MEHALEINYKLSLKPVKACEEARQKSAGSIHGCDRKEKLSQN